MRDRPQHGDNEDQAGDVEADQELTQGQKRTGAELADGEGDGAERADRRRPHHDADDICAAVPIRSVSGLPACPIALRPKPHSTEINRTCRTLPSANAPMNVLGMIPSTNSVVVRLWVCAR